MGKSKISWTDYTWNPITGCTKVSDGCKHCYAERLSKRLSGRGGYPKENPFEVTLHADKLDDPLHWKTPGNVFVCSMGDLFHPDVRFTWVDEVMAVIREASWLKFMILTKRPEIMMSYMKHVEVPQNLAIGTSIENQKMARRRLIYLVNTISYARFVSCEPLLGPVVLNGWNEGLKMSYLLSGTYINNTIFRGGIDLVICGGETGPGARPMHPEWVRGLRDQCLGSGARFHFKSWGEWAAADQLPGGIEVESRNGPAYAQYTFEDGLTVYRVGAKKSGRLLDGREWQ